MPIYRGRSGLLQATVLTIDLSNTKKPRNAAFYFHVGSGAWIRTKIDGFKGHCPAIRRSRIGRTISLQAFSVDSFPAMTDLL